MVPDVEVITEIETDVSSEEKENAFEKSDNPEKPKKGCFGLMAIPIIITAWLIMIWL